MPIDGKQVKPITIFDIYFFEPRVAAVVRRARYVRRGNERAYCRFKAEISIYVGWWAEIKALRSSYAYELCIAAIDGAMGSGPKRRRPK
jgi:hypothetical protein